jgi:bacterioferritin (cytochrome b1)
MVHADAFVAELEFKNQESFRGLLATSFLPALSGDGTSVSDLLRLEAKFAIESIESCAIWIADCESLELKIALSAQCGVHARHFERLQERLSNLGLAPGSYDPRQGGYSKLFAFLRSLQTSEERVAAGLLTLGGAAVARLAALIAVCQDKGDAESAELLQAGLLPDEQHRVDEGRDRLTLLTGGEDSQARARRAIYKTVELLGELYEPGAIRRVLGRRLSSV